MRLLFLAALLCLLLPTKAQTTGNNYQQQAADQGALYLGPIETPLNRVTWATHPYWANENFSVSDIHYGGVTYRNVPLRYDVYRGVVVVQSPSSHNNIIPQQNQVEWFTLGGMLFVKSRDQRFSACLYNGSHVALLLQRAKIPNEGYIENWHQIKDFDVRDTYLVSTEDTLCAVESVKDLMKIFPSHAKALRQYAKGQHLRFRGDRRRPSLLSCIVMLDKLLTVGSPFPAKQDTRLASLPQVPQTLLTPAEALLPPEQLDSTLTAYYAYLTNSGAQSNIDYTDSDVAILPDGNVTSRLEPISELHNLDEVEVTGFQQKVSGVTMGLEKFRPALLKNVPLALGEADVMKLLQTLPGVKTVGEASSGFNVRGGASDQNLILLNGNTIYNPMHMFGLFSAFNGDIIGETELHKSAISAQYGGRISSVMNIQNRAADRQAWHGSASIGLLTAKGTLDAPIVKDRVTLLLSGRTTYSDWMLKKLPEKSGYRDGTAGFYDLNASLAYTPNKRHRITAYGYYSHDRFSFTPYDGYGYSNANGALNWKGRYGEGDRLQTEVTTGYDHYDYLNEDSEVPTNAARLKFAINQYFFKGTATLQLNEKHSLLMGLHSILYDVNPGTYEPLDEGSNIAYSQLDKEQALESALFVEDQWKILPKLTLAGGLRWSMFNVLTEGHSKTYQAPELRVSASYMLDDNQSVKVGFNTMHQYIHKVSNTSIMSPTDTWTLSSRDIEPQTGWQLAAGYYMQTPNHQYEFTAEAYVKRMNHYLTYRSAGQLVMNPNLSEDVVPMQGRAYGIELQVRKPYGKLTGWMSYSYSRTQMRQHDGTAASLAINGGDWYATEYDRPHELKAVLNYKMTHRYSFSANADYSTGRPISVPAGQYYSQSQDRLLPYYTQRNGYRLPDYFRLDASFNIEPGHHLTLLTRHWFSIGVYNLLGRKNTYSVYYVAESSHIQGYKLSIFGAPIPFVSYNIKF